MVDAAVTNAVRHSRSRSCRVLLAHQAGALVVEVTDDGVGVPAVERQGVGIPSMRRRVEDLGGELEVRGSPTGTVVSARLPAVSGA